MKKSFFLLTATLVAFLSFSACSGSDDDDKGKGSSSSGTNGSSSSSGLTTACRGEMDAGGIMLDICMEVSGLSNSKVSELNAKCIEPDEDDGSVGTVVPKCPSAELVCPTTLEDEDEDDIEAMMYYYEPGATTIQNVFDGCPPW